MNRVQRAVRERNTIHALIIAHKRGIISPGMCNTSIRTCRRNLADILRSFEESHGREQRDRLERLSRYYARTAAN